MTSKKRVAVKPDMWELSKDAIEKYLREYDAQKGWYPEHPFEGYAVWRYLIEKIEGRKLDGEKFTEVPSKRV